MTAPINPDERAEWRALADAATEGPWAVDGFLTPGPGDSLTIGPAHDGALAYVQPVWADAEFIAAARTAVPRLLDALDTAEEKNARQRDRLRAREEQVRRLRAEVTRLHALVADLRAARSAPAWDEDTVTEAAARAMFPHYFTDDRQPLRVFTETRSDTELREAEREAARHRARQALAVVREHLPVRPDREALRRFVDSFCDDEAGEVEHVVSADGTSGFAFTGGNDAHAVLRKAASALWPGESRATVQAEALRDAADDRFPRYDTDVWLRARADRLDPTGVDRG